MEESDVGAGFEYDFQYLIPVVAHEFMIPQDNLKWVHKSLLLGAFVTCRTTNSPNQLAISYTHEIPYS